MSHFFVCLFLFWYMQCVRYQYFVVFCSMVSFMNFATSFHEACDIVHNIINQHVCLSSILLSYELADKYSGHIALESLGLCFHLLKLRKVLYSSEGLLISSSVDVLTLFPLGLEGLVRHCREDFSRRQCAMSHQIQPIIQHIPLDNWTSQILCPCF